MKIKRKLFGRIDYKGRTYKKSDTPKIGGIALSHKTSDFLTTDKYYLIDDFIWNDGTSTSLIGDDDKPC